MDCVEIGPRSAVSNVFQDRFLTSSLLDEVREPRRLLQEHAHRYLCAPMSISGPRNLPSFGDRKSDVLTFLAPVYFEDAMNRGSRVWKGGCSAYPDLAGQTLGKRYNRCLFT